MGKFEKRHHQPAKTLPGQLQPTQVQPAEQPQNPPAPEISVQPAGQHPTRMSAKKRRYKRYKQHILQLKITLFFLFLAVMCITGLLWFARPKSSTVEKRELTKFPAFTLASFWDGSYFSQIDTWYADTYPLREPLISMNSGVKSIYGVRSEQLVNNGESGDAIPEGTVSLEDLAGQLETQESTAPAETATGETTPTETEKPEGQGDVTAPAESAGTIYIAGNSGYGVYYFSQSASAKFCLLVNNVAEKCAETADVYCLVAPISAGIMLSDSVRESLGCSDEKESIDWMYDQMDSSVKTVSVYHTLKQHNDEYIYFHTDHHWTALGAYYAYREFCSAKGTTPHELKDFKTYEFPNFLGTFYSSSNQSPVLASNPDTVTSYIPNGTNDMTMYVSDGDGTYTQYDWRVVNDVSNYDNTQLYATFAGGDQPYNYAHNEKLHDGSAVLVVKDSYANAFIPFLVDHYEHIYWIDYRSYNSYCKWAGIADSSISALVKEKDIDDVLLFNNINSTSSKGLLEYMETIFK